MTVDVDRGMGRLDVRMGVKTESGSWGWSVWNRERCLAVKPADGVYPASRLGAWGCGIGLWERGKNFRGAQSGGVAERKGARVRDFGVGVNAGHNMVLQCVDSDGGGIQP